MKRRTLYLVLVVGSICLVAGGEELGKEKEAERGLPGWGTAIDPDRDCAFFVAHDSLLISVPGSRPHDLAADIKLTNAPRVLQSVSGDFTIQVKVEARVAPGEESTKPGRTGYDGAAIVAMSDSQNVVTLARGVLQRRGKEAVPYANFEMRVAGKLERIGRTSDHPLPQIDPVFLRLQRRGSTIHGAVSVDGTKWDALESKEVPADWPKELKIGVAAISTSTDEFNPRFSKLQIAKADPNPAEAKKIPADEPKFIKPEEAKDYIDKTVTVEFTVVASRELLDKNIGFLNSDKDLKSKTNFTAFFKNMKKFKEASKIEKPADHYLKKKVRVTGKVTKYREKLEIEIESPEQIKIVEESKPDEATSAETPKAK